MEIFTQIGIIIILASLLAYLFHLLKQPLIPAYVLAGLTISAFIASPFGSGLGFSKDTIWTLAEIGIAFLLFIVGLEINLERLKSVGFVSIISGTLVCALMFGTFFGLSIALGISQSAALYVGIVFMFSSTMVVVKLLSDQRELGTLHGKIAVGQLLMEDVIAVIILSLLIPGSGSLPIFLLIAGVKALLIVIGAIFLTKFVITPLFKEAAKDQKLLFLLSLGLCFLSSMVMFSLGFSIAIGGFIAGLILANTPYHLEIISHTKPLRDFFAILFFVALGMQLSIDQFGALVFPLVVMLVAFYLLKPIIIYLVYRFFGFTKESCFIPAMTLTQISEFSLIVALLGRSNGSLTSGLFSLVVLVAIITITTTSYFVKYDYVLYSIFRPLLSKFDPFKSREKHLDALPENVQHDTLLVGYHRLGFKLLRKLQQMGRTVLVVDYSPEVVNCLASGQIHCLYGDVGDMEVLERINLKALNLVISTVPDPFDNKLLIRKLHEVNPNAMIITTAPDAETALMLYDYGSDYVIVPHLLSGEYLSMLLDGFTSDMRNLVDAKLAHIDELKERIAAGKAGTN